MSLIDDLKPDGITALKTAGFNPAVVVQTSPGNFQDWLNYGVALPKDLSTTVARTLPEQFGGDTGTADWRHFGRLSGFSNRKEKHRRPDGLFPFVRLVETNHAVYPKAAEFVAQVHRKLEGDRAAAERRREIPGSNGGPAKDRQTPLTISETIQCIPATGIEST